MFNMQRLSVQEICCITRAPFFWLLIVILVSGLFTYPVFAGSTTTEKTIFISQEKLDNARVGYLPASSMTTGGWPFLSWLPVSCDVIDDMIIGPDKNLYISDTYGQQIIRVNTLGTDKTVIMKSSTLYPSDLAFDSGGNLIFTTRGKDGRCKNGATMGVWRIKGADPANSPECIVPASSFKSTQAGCDIPRLCYVSRGTYKGDILLTGAKGGAIVRAVGPDFKNIVPFITDDQVKYPADAIVLLDASILVSDFEGSKVLHFSDKGEMLDTFTSMLSRPNKMQVDSDGLVYIADSVYGGRSIQILTVWTSKGENVFRMPIQAIHSIAVLEPAPPNQPPHAVITVGEPAPVAGTLVKFYGASSSDPDGTIKSFKWNFGDGHTAWGESVSHIYTHSGTFSVTLVVTDNEGESSPPVNKTITVRAPNKPPIARFTFSPNSPDTGMGVSFSAATSTDVDGTIKSFKWNFGDGQTSEGRYATHVFSHSGTFNVTLTVVDDDGASNSITSQIIVQEPNKLPVARFTWKYAEARVAVEPRAEKVSIIFDASASEDPDGEVITYSWDWDSDGVYDDTSKEAVSVHTFPTTAEFDITLQVTDNEGATGKVTKPVKFIGPQPPSADFDFAPPNPSLLDTVSFTDNSSDPDGSIVKYSWNFGDGSVSTDPNPKHVYTRKGLFTVTLTVIDNSGLTATKATSITVVNVLPKAQFTFSPNHPELGMGVLFDASQSDDPDGEIASYLWDFDNNGTMDAEGSTVTWSFPKEGIYSVSLTVVDEEGEKSEPKLKKLSVCSPQLVKPKQTWAVIIGVSEYEYVTPSLEFPAADAKAVADFFIEKAGVPPDHVKTFYDSQATLSSIWAAMDWLTRVAGPDDLAIFFFAGHGYRGPDNNGDEKDEVDEFIVPYDAIKEAMDATCLRDDDFGNRFIDKLRSEHVLMILDSCYSGGGTRGERSLHSNFRPTTGEADIFNDFNLQGRLVLAASTEAQAAWEDAALKHGVFTYFLLQGLEGKADENNDHKVTVHELFPYLSDEVSTYTRVHEGKEQNPVLIGEGRRGIELPMANIPPYVDFVWKPDSPILGMLVQFSDMSSDADGTVQAWRWDFGDGITSDKQNPTHIYEKQGMYSVTLKVEDDQHTTSEKTLPIKVSVSAPPTADFSWIPSHPWNAEMVSFSDKSRAPNGNIVAWDWDFGDGTTSTDQNPMHAYSSAQEYTVVLKVQDTNGTYAEAKKRLEITLSSYVMGTPAEAQNPNVYLAWLAPNDRPGAIVGAKVEVFTREISSYGLFETLLASGQIVGVLSADRVVIEVHPLVPTQIKPGMYVRPAKSTQ